MNAVKHTQDELRQFAQEHAPKLAENITKLCGTVIAKGMQGILEEVCRIKLQRDELLEALCKLNDAADDSDGCQYGTLSTSFVRNIASAAIAKVDAT